jgi:cell shape-determining protein MreC
VVAVAALGLSVLALAVPAAWVSRARMRAVSDLGPLMRAGASVSVRRGVPGAASGELEASDDPRALRDELLRLRHEIVRLEDERSRLGEELVRARGFLGRSRAAGLDLDRFIHAEVIGHAVNWQERTFTVDRGTEDGVVVRAGCLAGGSVVGTVVEVGPRAARVAMATEHGVRIAARTVRTRRPGLLVGTGGGAELRYLARWTASGERPCADEPVVTTGRLGFFPPGFLLGRVASVGESPESLHLNVAVRPEVEEPPQGGVWILRPAPRDVYQDGTEE